MKFEDFWYVVALSEQLKAETVLSRTVLGEWLAIFRGEDGKPVALRDRCLHRNSRLSRGKVCAGKLHCPYHGWVYDELGRVVGVPAEGNDFNAIAASRQGKRYATLEQDGYVYVRLADEPCEDFKPFTMPYYGKSGWETVRTISRFQNTVTNCVENFLDIPHTASVHPGVFRKACQQQLEMVVERQNGTVLANYRRETNNLGWYAKFLNPRGNEIKHIDGFYMPNVTSVEYDMDTNRRFFITSQSIPESESSTLVYTDITFNYGIWNKIARFFMVWTARKLLRQDMEALKIQRDVIEKYGTHFSHTPADTIHIFVESIRNKIHRGEDPRKLPDKSACIQFWV
ncbi:MAG: aromatic ring-hydroxylating dioxygenase subunit alpha [Cyanobacteriota bacterium]|nr:aromatic ring-hydroxylating dioxygenase subunit alpha [Cyanobacteriota bacterium]